MIKRKCQKYPPPKVIAIDVDGTLLIRVIRGEINKKLVNWCKEKKAAGFCMMLWSSRGEKHAANIAEQAGLLDVLDAIISKPGYVVDDQCWKWIKYTRVITTLDT